MAFFTDYRFRAKTALTIGEHPLIPLYVSFKKGATETEPQAIVAIRTESNKVYPLLPNNRHLVFAVSDILSDTKLQGKLLEMKHGKTKRISEDFIVVNIVSVFTRKGEHSEEHFIAFQKDNLRARGADLIDLGNMKKQARPAPPYSRQALPPSASPEETYRMGFLPLGATLQ